MRHDARVTLTDMLIESAETKVGRAVGGMLVIGTLLAAVRRLRSAL